MERTCKNKRKFSTKAFAKDFRKKSYPKGFSAVNIKPCKKGNITISEVEVPPVDPITRMRASMNGYGRYAPEGTYTRLHVGYDLMMSDTPDEAWDCVVFYEEAKGKVLINGLGIGFVLKAILAKPEVTEVTVIEISQDIIDLVSPYYDDPRVTIICADAMTWRPPKGTKYDVVWHDIWPELNTDNLPEYATLNWSYGQRTKWQGAWGQDILKQEQRKENRYGWW